MHSPGLIAEYHASNAVSILYRLGDTGKCPTIAGLTLAIDNIKEVVRENVVDGDMDALLTA